MAVSWLEHHHALWLLTAGSVCMVGTPKLFGVVLYAVCQRFGGVAWEENQILFTELRLKACGLPSHKQERLTGNQDLAETHGIDVSTLSVRRE